MDVAPRRIAPHEYGISPGRMYRAQRFFQTLLYQKQERMRILHQSITFAPLPQT
jgi:hypothetical protein